MSRALACALLTWLATPVEAAQSEPSLGINLFRRNRYVAELDERDADPSAEQITLWAAVLHVELGEPPGSRAIEPGAEAERPVEDASSTGRNLQRFFERANGLEPSTFSLGS